MEQEYLTTPFEIKKMKERGAKEVLANCIATEHFFNPMVDDLDKISNFIKDCKKIVDVGSGYGLLITKLAKLNGNKDFLGIDTVYWEGNRFPIPKGLSNLKFEFNGIEAMAYSDKFNQKKRKFDCVICSWMPMGSDWREMLSMLSTKKIILVLSKDFNTGTMETYCGMERLGFKLKGRASTSYDSIIQLWEKV